jgi:hypothetical protein
MPKADFIQAFFDEFGRKIGRLSKLFEAGFRDEAFTLCIVYIDRLASGHYGGDPGKNRENFCRALRELSGNPLFAMLHPRELLERTEKKFPGAVPLVKTILEKAPGALLEQAEVARVIKSSSLDESAKLNLTQNLWRASVASICYQHVRGPEIHGPGSGGLDFDETMYNGKRGVKVDSRLVYDALCSIHKRIKDKSVQSGNLPRSHIRLMDSACSNNTST